MFIDLQVRLYLFFVFDNQNVYTYKYVNQPVLVYQEIINLKINIKSQNKMFFIIRILNVLNTI